MAKPGRKSKSESLEAPPPRKGGRQKLIFGSKDEERWHKNEVKRKSIAKSKGFKYKLRPYPGSGVESKPPAPITKPPVVSTDQMVDMMREVFKDMGGIKKLKSHMQSNPKDFGAMLQNLMKIEASLEEARIKKGGGEDGKGVFVVLKGLSEDDKCPHCGKKVNDPVSSNELPEEHKEQPVVQIIDMASMASVLNPGAEVIREGGDW